MTRKLVLLGTLVLLAGCASQPPPVDPAPVMAANTSETAPTSIEAQDPKGPPPGWSRKKRAGKLVYCKTVEVTGSHFPQEACLEPERLEEILRLQKKQAERTLDIPVTN